MAKHLVSHLPADEIALKYQSLLITVIIISEKLPASKTAAG